ncbi:MAG: helix-turn-helix domain-containing protein [Bacteroidales bacterium]|jgi:hypothetical protein|nr:helix-turn-helix domain-containing protein [Bacteroidales bacterium]
MEETTVKKSNHGANVRRWREWRNINQDVLAEQVGVSQATMYFSLNCCLLMTFISFNKKVYQCSNY